MKNSWLIYLLVLGLYLPCKAAKHYIRADAPAGGDGTDWERAWQQLPEDLVRGDTFYIADGYYPGYTFDDAEVGSLYIWILKATLEAHGTDIGWDDSYGDGQATWPGWNISKGRYIFDGITGQGAQGDSYGFHLTPDSCNFSSTYILAQFGTAPNCSYVEFRHIFFEGCGNTDPVCSYGIKSNSYQGYNVGSVIAHNLFYGHAVHLVLYHWRETLVEYNFFDANWSSANCHGEQVTFGNSSDEVIYRYNIHRNSATGGLGMHHNDNKNWQVYGNIFYGGHVTMGVIGCADSLISSIILLKTAWLFMISLIVIRAYSDS